MMHDLTTQYLLGELDEDATAAYEAHLEDCARCRSELAAMAPAVDALAWEQEITASPGLRERVLSEVSGTMQLDELAVQREKNRGSAKIVQLALGVAASVAVLVFAMTLLTRSTPIDRIVDSDTAVVLALDATEAYQDQATVEAVYRADTGEVALLADSLAPTRAGRTYQAWVITDEAAIPAGVFVPDADGSVRVVLEGTYPEGALIGITEEPDGGSPAPTSDVLFLTS